ncbi:MAG: DUF2797 domain-containing protein [Candidatus Nomurabacteria bacterium]|jgi:hypothetical protein|nr:DUF2797 domain-containing protein [Candidatus Nomurabacteria bacterium]
MVTLFTYFSFDKDGRPYYRLTDGSGEISTHIIKYDEDLTLEFDQTRRFCTGGHDLGTYDSWACPTHAEVDKKYEQCKQCMDKTGFNPAFYYSDEISDQQAEYNQQPHNLYLAYFDDGNLKVGISHTRRGLARLLEQGARAAIVLDEFTSANVARQYEAKIARLDWVNENVKLSKKIDILGCLEYDPGHAASQLKTAKHRIDSELGVTLGSDEVIDLNRFYGDTTSLKNLNDMSEQGVISGKILACVGSILIAENDGEKLLLPIKKFVGYNATISDGVKSVELAPKQFSLF